MHPLSDYELITGRFSSLLRLILFDRNRFCKLPLHYIIFCSYKIIKTEGPCFQSKSRDLFRDSSSTHLETVQ